MRLETQVAMCDDANRLAIVDDGHSGYPLGAREFDNFTDGLVRRNGYRVSNDAALKLLDASDFPGLVGRTHVLVNDSDTAFLSERDSKPRLGNGVHGRRHQRDIQLYLARHVGGQRHFTRQNIRVLGPKEYIIEGKGFLSDSHNAAFSRLSGACPEAVRSRAFRTDRPAIPGTRVSGCWLPCSTRPAIALNRARINRQWYAARQIRVNYR